MCSRKANEHRFDALDLTGADAKKQKRKRKRTKSINDFVQLDLFDPSKRRLNISILINLFSFSFFLFFPNLGPSIGKIR